jgi:hypothetical protein
MADEKLSDALAAFAAAFRRELGIPFDGVILTHGPKQIGPFPLPAGADALTLSDADHTILTAVSEIGGAPKAAAVAKVAGQKNDANLGRSLSTLRKRGLLGGDPGSPGYPLTTLGEQALSSADADDINGH